ncbi:tRNA adenosine(34) deaminase TadA [Coprothermobacter platensis]|uniref:tRNA adenosine(34) deaminase TadA n=1 Tax=Coprothermobacter platensis TaxID=108819 RepID=UPI0003723FCC|nr:tRNA adenosine(34) deaminase TadA [Coprothermobacter platensis]
MLETDTYFMHEALKEALKAYRSGDVPVGAVVVVENAVVGRGHNLRERDNDPTAHAEIYALRDAGAILGRWNLSGATLYVTLEPCLMCCYAAVLSRVDRVVFGAYDPKAGALVSNMDFLSLPFLNHRFDVEGGVMAERCGALLHSFFKTLRDEV